MGFFRVIGTLSGRESIGGGEACCILTRGADGGVTGIGGTEAAGARMGSGRTGADTAGVLVEAASLVGAVTGGGGKESLDTAETVTRVPTLPADEPEGGAAVFGGLVLGVPDIDRNVLLVGIGGSIRAP